MGGGESGLCGLPMVVPQHSAESLAAMDDTVRATLASFRVDQSVVQPLVIPLSVVQPHNTRPTKLNCTGSSIPGARCLAAMF